MENMNALLSIILLFALNIAIPGANFFWITKTSLDHGRREGWYTSLGATFTDMLYALASMAGLTLVVGRHPMLLPSIGLMGGIWLAFCGLRMILLPKTVNLEAEESSENAGWSSMKAFKLGMLINLTNPQSLIFFSAVIAASLPRNPSVEQDIFLLAGFLIISLVFRGGVALIFSTNAVRDGLTRLRRPLAITSALALFIIGTHVAWNAIPYFIARFS